MIKLYRARFCGAEGKIRLSWNEIRHRATKPGTTSVDEVTCLTTYTERGTYRVTSGTGAYEDARGHGHYRVKVVSIGCDEDAPEVFTLEIRASGPLHL